jgi:hypothetical protein
MFLLAFLFGCASSVAIAQEKEEDKARAAAVAFLKAVKSKDVAAVMKTADVPFMLADRNMPKLVEKTDDLKTELAAMLEKIKDVDKIPQDSAMVYDLPAIRKKLEDRKKDEILKSVEKVLGGKGYIVTMKKETRESGAVLVRVKDGKAVVVGIVD